MFTSSAKVFRMRQVVSDLTNCIINGREAITRLSLRAHVDAFPRFMANNGRFDLTQDRDFYADVLFAAAMPDDDFPAFTTATSMLLLDLLQNGDGSDDLFWNWDSFQSHYRLADPAIRAAIMNAFRIGFEMGSVRPETPPKDVDCLTAELDKVSSGLAHANLDDLLRAVEADVSAKDAGQLWRKYSNSIDPLAMPGFRYLYERPASLVPPHPGTAPLIPWS